MIGGLQITDLTFILLFLPLFSNQVKLKDAFQNKDIMWLFKFLLFFSLSYHIIIFGFIAPGGSLNNLLNLLQYERLSIFGWIVLIPAFIFFKRDHQYIIKISLIISIVILILFYLTYLGIDLITIIEIERYRGSGIIRRGLISYGFAMWFMYFAIIIFIIKLPMQGKRSIYTIAIMFFIATIFTLTRRSYISISTISFIIILLLNLIRKKEFILIPYLKFGVIIFILFVTLSFFNPIIIEAVQNGILDIQLMVTKGETTQGTEDLRLVHDIPRHIDRFKESPWIGFGYNEDWYSNQPKFGGLSANDSPLTAALGMFGVIGCALFLIYYLKIIMIIKNKFYLLKTGYRQGIHLTKPYIFLFAVYMIASIFYLYTIGFMNYFDDIIVGERRVIEMMMIGFLLATFNVLKNSVSEKSKQITL